MQIKNDHILLKHGFLSLSHPCCTGCSRVCSTWQGHETLGHGALRVCRVLLLYIWLFTTGRASSSTGPSCRVQTAISTFRNTFSLYVTWISDISAHTAIVYNSSSAEVLAEQAAVLREGRRLFHPIPDTSCVVKPVKTQYIYTDCIHLDDTNVFWCFLWNFLSILIWTDVYGRKADKNVWVVNMQKWTWDVVVSLACCDTPVTHPKTPSLPSLNSNLFLLTIL